MSENLIEQYKQKHREVPGYGSGPDAKEVEEIRGVLREIDWLEPNSVLDYGAGKSNLAKQLFPEAATAAYDPAIPGRHLKPRLRFDLVICTDVLEHIPTDEVGDLLADIVKYSDRAFFTIHTGPAYHKLPDGSNCHCTIKGVNWWVAVLETFFELVSTRPANRKKAHFAWGELPR